MVSMKGVRKNDMCVLEGVVTFGSVPTGLQNVLSKTKI